MQGIIRNIIPCQRCGSKELLYPGGELYETVKVTCNGCGRYYGHYTHQPTVVKKVVRKKTIGQGDREIAQDVSQERDWLFQ